MIIPQNNSILYRKPSIKGRMPLIIVVRQEEAMLLARVVVEVFTHESSL